MLRFEVLHLVRPRTSIYTVEYEGLVPPKFERELRDQIAPHKDPIIARCELIFDERVVLHRVARSLWCTGVSRN